jgi:hypothetical protein
MKKCDGGAPENEFPSTMVPRGEANPLGRNLSADDIRVFIEFFLLLDSWDRKINVRRTEEEVRAAGQEVVVSRQGNPDGAGYRF